MKTTDICQITKKELPIDKLAHTGAIRKEIINYLKKMNPSWNGEGYISEDKLKEARNEYLKKLLQDDKGEMNQLDEEVLNSLQNEATITRDINSEITERLTTGQRIADKVASFGGSWSFIIMFLLIIIIWILGNIYLLTKKPFDPYPFILLNLVLSCVAALQAPVIMMSQNRQEAKDRIRSQNDYKVNMKAELEIRQLHQKMDHLLLQQHQRLFEIQEMQMEILEEILKKVSVQIPENNK
jgi:uncharacterized membrane protein